MINGKVLDSFFTQSHQERRESKELFLSFQACQKVLAEATKSASTKIEELSFHLPGPRGIGSGIEILRATAQWSKKGHGKISQEST